MGFVIISVVAGFVGVWILQAIINWVLISRIMDDPFKGKMLATVIAYFTASLLHSFGSGTAFGFLIYLPGAVLVAILEMRGARKVQARIDEQDHASAFE